MNALSIHVIDARPAAAHAAPAVVFRLRIVAPGERVHALMLRCQVQIAARQRSYDADERERLYELFGDATQFDRQVQAVTWAHCPVALPAFEGSVECDVAVPCTYDLEVASAKYWHAVRDGDVPVQFAFSGTVFRVDQGTLRVEPVSWNVDASWLLPAAVWRSTMDRFFPDSAWIRVDRATLDTLLAFRGRAAMLTWDDTLARLLACAGEDQPV